MSETPKLTLADLAIPNRFHEFAEGSLGEVTPDDIRAAVVPLLDLEAAALIVRELLDRVPPDLDGGVSVDSTVWALAIVDAALGLGEPTSQGGEK